MHIIISAKSFKYSILNYTMLYTSGAISLIDSGILPISPSIIILGLTIISYIIFENINLKSFQFPFIIFSVTCLLSFIYAAPQFVEKGQGFRYIAMLVSIFLLFQSINNKNDIRILLLLFTAGIVLVSIDYILIEITGVQIQMFEDQNVFDTDEMRWNSILLGNNMYAAISITILFITTHFIYFSENKLPKIYLSVIFLIISALIITKSRTGYSMLGVYLIYFVFFSGRQISFIQRILTLTLLLIGGLYLLNASDFLRIVIERFENIEDDSSNNVRKEILDVAQKSIDRFPLFGQGIFTFQNYSASFFKSGKSTHNTIYEILYSMGYTGMLFFIYYSVYPFIKFVKYYHSMTLEDKKLSIIFLLSMISLLIAGIKHEILYERFYYLIVGAFSAYLSIISSQKDEIDLV